MQLPFDHPLFQQALTHSSTLASDALKAGSYERLEFLGDRILGFLIASMLFEQFPNESEGGLARRLSLLVNQQTLALIADQSGLTPHIKISAKEKFAHDGQPSASVLSDVVEAVIAALFLIDGWEPVKAFVQLHWQPLLDSYAIAPVEPKTALQEWAQARGLALPVYELVERSGPDHRPHFIVSVTVPGQNPMTGEGASKQTAEKAAATLLLDHLTKIDTTA
jgi:ribonuclease-3